MFIMNISRLLPGVWVPHQHDQLRRGAVPAVHPEDQVPDAGEAKQIPGVGGRRTSWPVPV